MLKFNYCKKDNVKQIRILMCFLSWTIQKRILVCRSQYQSSTGKDRVCESNKNVYIYASKFCVAFTDLIANFDNKVKYFHSDAKAHKSSINGRCIIRANGGRFVPNLNQG